MSAPTSPLVFRFCQFAADPWGHGGERRAAQVERLLSASGVQVVQQSNRPTPLRQLSITEQLMRMAQGADFLRRTMGLRHSGGPQTWLRHWAHVGGFVRRMRSLPLPGAIITDDTDWFVYFWAASRKIPLIGLPHNLESLVPMQRSKRSGKQSPNWLGEELQALRNCAAVFTISREEQWLLRLHGIPAEFLPYYPVAEAEQSFLQIRERRLCRAEPRSGRRKFLIVGSFGNIPTRLGLLDRIQFFLREAPHQVEIHVAGFWSDDLRVSIASSDRLIMHGTVSQDVLNDLLVEVDAVILHQPPTSGALTRIPELLLAGMPLIVCVNAARSYHQQNGVWVYEDDAEFLQLLAKPDFPVPDAPKRPVAHEQRFIECVRKLCTNSAAQPLS